MKNFLSILALTLGCACSLNAQESGMQRRGRVMNVSETTSPMASQQHRVGSRTSAPLPCTGRPKVPVILVQFPDKPFTSAETEEEVVNIFQKHFNGSGIPGQRHQVSGGSWGSVSDYFIEQSDSIFQPDFTIIGPVTLSQGYAYYGQNRGSSKDVNIGQFYSEACKLAVANFNVEWSDFDNNNDDKVDFAFFIYAGYGENDTENDDPDAIWPKESVSALTVTANEKKIVFGSFGCCNEIYEGKLDGIGTICHELSHGLGLPDLYDYNYEAFGMDIFDIMDYGNYQANGFMPCCYSGYERDFMGWRKLEEISAYNSITLVLDPIEAGGKAYKIVNPDNKNEYFILENRQNIGFDTYYGVNSGSNEVKRYGTCHGLLITHIDYDSNAWTNNKVNYYSSHQRYTPVPADGDLYKGDDDDEYMRSLRTDLYPAGGTEMSDYSIFTGKEMDIKVWDIKENEDLTVSVNICPMSVFNAILPIGTNAEASAIYGIDGTQHQSLQRGLNIVRMDDGSVKKLFVK